MDYIIDRERKLAQVWMSHADQNDSEKEEELKGFIADCRARKIFVCVYRSGSGDLLENTKELLAYNYNNPVRPARSRDDAR